MHGPVLFYDGLICLIALLNRLLWPRLNRDRENVGPKAETFTSGRWKNLAPVALLIPARNEAHQIRRCLEAIGTSTDSSLEIIALDDESTDDTWSVLKETKAEANQNLTLLRGTPRPQGWRGKNWACAQLADHAGDAEILIFIDADTRLEAGAVENIRSTMLARDIQLLSVLPRQEAHGLAALLVYLLPWSLMAHVPLFLGRWRRKALPIAIGQVLAFQRSAYQTLGGHAAVRSAIAEDLALARKAARMGMIGAFLDGADIASCTMYTSWVRAWRGFQKNWCYTVGHPLLSCLIWAWLTYAFTWLPMYGLAEACLGHLDLAALSQWPALLWIGVCSKRYLQMPIWVFVTAPISVALGFVLACDSWIHNARNTTIWS
ncbi:glycosyltransferase [Alicyclobacillus acidocaldarius]|uniref:4,4'-diaponeurosporenoate glycosyltransferase n=1 Tax=Alicyclobacillus acidocaldarius subsp. acidocaldarius (strain ATCC 27009 / DSM 446 / BCRC 14685 / JCM 5260 / KCTC 1825 / NBRC 15652 / NCIMB 11725 / NRRL B-14509 / 104-IA) TaxID=521098 RepID=C8WUL2_ALIAD|nr:glycosyltransferase [Alicyclobacillus acidocaldarius]ACV59828.1 glycosyl transferase family 2 [Alicyclobacillus acidocaldarius subsp. acidocaldarius DSM 446]